MGLRRYGFHGLSYTYLLEKLSTECGETAVNGRVILAHLGSGASLTATSQSKPIDTTMALTPASGIPMSTRSGDVDPGIFLQLHNLAGLDYCKINSFIKRAFVVLLKLKIHLFSLYLFTLKIVTQSFRHIQSKMS